MRNPETGRSTAARHPTRRTQMKESSLDFSEVGRCGAKTRSGNKWKWKQMSCSRDAKPQDRANPACGGRLTSAKTLNEMVPLNGGRRFPPNLAAFPRTLGLGLGQTFARKDC